MQPTQVPLFGTVEHLDNLPPPVTEQGEQLERVKGRIEKAIAEFFRYRTTNGALEFHADDLRDWVADRVGTVAPDSPGRIMRIMRRQQSINYEVSNRARSLYEVKT